MNARRRGRARALAVSIGLLAVAACHRPAPPLTVERADGGVVAKGLDGRMVEELRAAGAEAWRRALQVKVVVAGLDADETPPVHGTWELAPGSLRFTPSFPFAPATRYRARFRWPVVATDERVALKPAASVERTGRGQAAAELAWETPSPEVVRPARVTRVEPTASSVPANLLRLYVHVSESMQPGHAYEHLILFDLTAGQRVDQPFVEVELEVNTS